MGKFLYRTHLVRCIFTTPSECGKLYFRTNSILNFINDFEKKFIYWASLNQDLYQN